MEKREPMQLEIDGDTLYFTTSNKKYETKIQYHFSWEFYVAGINFSPVSLLFNKTGIKDKGQFQREILGYSFNTTGFPSCHTREDVIKLAKAIVDYNNSQIKGNFFLRERKNIKFNFNL